jgi:hypothetical protein
MGSSKHPRNEPQRSQRSQRVEIQDLKFKIQDEGLLNLES